MLKTIDTIKLQNNLDNILINLNQGNDTIVIKNEKTYLATLLPYHIFKEWLEILEEVEDLKDVAKAERLWKEHREAFMSFVNFEEEWNALEAAGKI
ncbi:MAG: hypothetical protein B6242_17030 [Anaerolineaceae bacterium 4572_78]|nr:MAG: hypothetical protein B6242_17030 [Anaerolineaceae bacterium 4572_78]